MSFKCCACCPEDPDYHTNNPPDSHDIPCDTCDADPLAINVAHLRHQRAWSYRTFGPGPRTEAVLAHIREELDEVTAQPDDVTEWADVIILAFDGAYRAGHEPATILQAIKDKQKVNEARIWPDWRTQPADQPIHRVGRDA